MSIRRLAYDIRDSFIEPLRAQLEDQPGILMQPGFTPPKRYPVQLALFDSWDYYVEELDPLFSDDWRDR